MKKVKLKKSVKAFLIIVIVGIIIVSLVICKFLLLNKYNKNYSNIKRIYDNGEILEKIDLTKVHATKYIYLDDINKISIDYNTFEKVKTNSYKITTDDLTYTFKFNIENSKDKHAYYFDMISSIETIVKNKITIWTPLIVEGSKAKKANLMNRDLHEYDKIVVIDGNYVDGYSYMKDNIYYFILYGNNQKFEITFEGNNLSYEYLTTVISTLGKD